MLGLLLASIWVLAIIVGFVRRIGRLRRTSEKFESDFWKADDIDAFHRLQKDRALPIESVFGAGVSEWRRSTAGKAVDRAGMRERPAHAMGAARPKESDRLWARLKVVEHDGEVGTLVRATCDVRGRQSQEKV